MCCGSESTVPFIVCCNLLFYLKGLWEEQAMFLC